MQKANLPWLFILNVFLLIVLAVSLSKPDLVKSATAGHLVFSEIKVSGSNANDEFIELYNPTDSVVDLAGWRMVRKTETGTASNLISSMSGTIPAKGYFLLANNESPASPSADIVYSAGLAPDNSLLLYSDAGVTLIDKVGMGTAIDSEASAPAQLPPANQSIERKAKTSSTQSSMLAEDANMGNGEDTDNNSNDFVLRDTPQPQNTSASTETPDTSPSPTSTASASPSESASPSASSSPSPSESPSASPSASASPSESTSPSPSPSVTPSPSASPSESASPSPSPSPSVSPSASASPSVSPSPSPSPSASPSPSVSPSPSPSPSASPSVSPSPSASPSPSVTPSAPPSVSPSVAPSIAPSPSHTPHPTSTPKPRNKLFCSFEPETIKFGRWEFTFHVLSCKWIKV